MNKLLIFLLGFMLLLSCKRTKFYKSLPVKHEKPSIKINQLDFEYFQSKAKIDYDDGTNQFASPMTIRIRKDSVIWISINPALGIEVVRALITRDSVFVIDKIHKDFYALDLRYVKNNFGVDLTFTMIQSALLGNLITPIKEEDTENFEGDYAMLRQREDQMDIRNFIGKNSKKIESVIITDTTTRNNLTLKYTDFMPVDTSQFAFTSHLLANYKQKQGLMKSNIVITHQKVDLKDKQMRFPFNVKSKYERK